MTYCRIDEPKLYIKAMKNISSLQSIPKPLGEQALRVLTMIQTEQRINGYSIIKHYVEESRCPRAIVENKPIQPIFYIINEQLQFHLTWASIVGINQLGDHSDLRVGISESAMAVFLLGILKYVGGKEINIMVKNALIASSSKSLRDYWSTLQEIFHDESWEVDSKRYQQKTQDKLNLLYEKILTLKNPYETEDLFLLPQIGGSGMLQGTLTEQPKVENKARSISRPGRSSVDFDMAEDAKVSVGCVTLDELQDPYTPTLPDLYHAALIINTKTPPDFPQKGAIASQTHMFPQNCTFAELLNLFNKVKFLTADNSESLKIRLVLTGGSDTLHHFTIAFVNLMCEHKNPLPERRLHSQEIVEDIELEVFVVPFAPCPLAQFLAREDSWYHRHVYTPFKNLSLLTPSISNNTHMRMDSERSKHSLGDFYRTLISNYTREARNTLKVNI